MSWAALRDLGVTVRPLSGIQPERGFAYSRFQASLSTTLKLLARELDHLYAERIVIELGIREEDIRLDGYPRANAKPTSTPAVAISFASQHGPLRYATAEFEDWQSNLRAIALSMEALRAVDRYGVSKRGEQYQGWKAIPMSTDPADAIQTREQAVAVISEAARVAPALMGTSDESLKAAVREAIRRTHPDHGGDPDEFRKVMRAKELVG